VVIPGRFLPWAITIHPSAPRRTHQRALWHGNWTISASGILRQPERAESAVELCCTLSVTFFFFFCGQLPGDKEKPGTTVDGYQGVVWPPEGIPTVGSRAGPKLSIETKQPKGSPRRAFGGGGVGTHGPCSTAPRQNDTEVEVANCFPSILQLGTFTQKVGGR